MGSQVSRDEKPLPDEVMNSLGILDRRPSFSNDMESFRGRRMNAEGLPPAFRQSRINEPTDWVQVYSANPEDNWYGTPLTKSETEIGSTTSDRTVSSFVNNAQPSDAIKLAIAEEDLKQMQSRDKDQCLVIKTHENSISALERKVEKERVIAHTLGTKLFDLFVVMTQNQQHELDKFQERLMDLQTDAEHWLLGNEWQHLHQKLHNLNRKLDGYMNASTPQAICAGFQTDELTLFLSSLLSDLPKLWNGLVKLERTVVAEKVRYVEEESQSDEPKPKRAAEEIVSTENVDNADASSQRSVTDILDRYYEFSRRQRERMATRKDKLQALLNRTLTELSRLQADLVYEEGRTANMKTRVAFWAEDPEMCKVKCPAELVENLGKKQSALERGSQEIERITGIIQELPSHFHVIDIRIPEEGAASKHPELIGSEAKGVSGTQDHESVTGRREDALYIAELEAKLRQKQADEKAWATHMEKMQLRQETSQAELQERIYELNFKTVKFRKGIDAVVSKLFEHRERLWGLSTPARELGEELISALEQLGISCDDASIYL
ncbi:hypothetical protein F4861DRAFT_444616 [Xylaria intraflava]|nr:hypothetical protein F4861DRAFT_444616 [Xylaria intraflava]